MKMAILRGQVRWAVAALVLVLLTGFAAAADPPKPPPMTAEQQQQLKERDRYAAETGTLRAQGKLAEAIAACEKMLAIERAVFGDVHEDVVGSLEQLAQMHEQRQEFAAAHQALAEVLQIRIQLHGKEDWRVADARWALTNNERISQMDPGQRKRLAEANQLDERVRMLYSQGKFAQAMEGARQVQEIYHELFGPAHPLYAASLSNLSVLAQAQGDYLAAESLIKQALEIGNATLGTMHPENGRRLNNLAMGYRLQGDYDRAESLYRQSLEVLKKTRGEADLLVAHVLNNLAALDKTRGNLVQAEQELQQAVGIYKKAFGEASAEHARSLNNLSQLRYEQGDYAGAEVLLRQTLEIEKKLGKEEHPEYATALNNLAAVYHKQGQHALAEPLYQQALAIDKKALGESHPGTATDLCNLAVHYEAQGDEARAEQLFLQALAIRKKAWGENHPDYALNLQNLALLYLKQGDYARAEPLFRQAVEDFKNALGEAHPRYAIVLHNLAALYQEQHNYARAEALLHSALEITRKNLELTSAIQGERQQLAMAQSFQAVIDTYLGMGPEHLSARRAYQETLAWKGAIFSRQRRLRLARETSDPELAKRFGDLQRTATQLAALAFQVPDPAKRDAWQKQLRDLTEQREQMEIALSGRSAAFHSVQTLQRVTPEEMQAALPDGTALIDLLEYTRCSRNAEGKYHYQRHLAAFVVRQHRAIAYVDLGPAEPIAVAVERWRAQIMGVAPASSDGDSAAAAELRRLVWQPLERHVRGAQAVLVSPDGALNYVPFAALPGARAGSYLIEELPIAVIPVPQLLPEMLAERHPANHPGTELGALFLVGDVDFGAAPGQPASQGVTGLVAMRGNGELVFPRLPGTAAEIASIHEAFAQAHPHAAICELRGAQATEEAFRREAGGKRYLHLSTHGFFAPPQLKSALESTPDERGGRDRGIGFNPGLLSGLALAGCNRGPQMAQESLQLSDDGILTALEVAELDLSAAELVVLSACETGLGKVAGGEGLLGLQRAFQVAGARTVVASLWKVDDEATRQLMTIFYENLWKRQLPPLEALRQAQLQILHHSSTAGLVRGLGSVEPAAAEKRPGTHPRLWAAWVLSGNPGNLLSLASPNPIRMNAAQAQIGGTLAALVLVLAGLSAVQVRRLSRDRAGPWAFPRG
ncbi:MAG TPA: CHAT domain-containing tetratricopeptide repeat protein [Gemmataceae bacterium]|nr:CHAT domain-containing tetratricopeptide repeat protein [Gemmataceae bacterium]